MKSRVVPTVLAFVYVFNVSISSAISKVTNEQKLQRDYSFARIVKSHWCLQRSGTSTQVKMDFRIDNNGLVKVVGIENLLSAEADKSDKFHGIDPVLYVTIYDSLKAGCNEYVACVNKRVDTYTAIFKSGPHINSTVRIDAVLAPSSESDAERAAES